MKVYPYIPGFVLNYPSGIKTAYNTFLKVLRMARIRIAKSPLEDDIDIFHAHFYTPDVVLLNEYFSGKGARTVITAHSSRTDIRDSFWFFRILERPAWEMMKLSYGKFDAVVAPTQYAANLLRQDSIRAVSISNGINLAFWKRRNPERFMKRHGLGKPLVIGIGTVTIRKGCDVFAYVAKNLSANFAWIGKMFKSLLTPSDYRKLMDIPSNMKYIDYVRDIRNAYSAANVLLAPTRTETQGLVILEAGAMGVPIVARNLPVFREFEEKGISGEGKMAS